MKPISGIALYSIFLGLVAGSCLLSYQAYTNKILSFDIWAHHLVTAFQTPSLTFTMKTISLAGTIPGVVISVCLASLIFIHYRRIPAGLFMLSVFAWDSANEGFKSLISRPRPGYLGLVETDSFPSGHVFHTMIFLGTIWLLLYPNMTFRSRLTCGVGFSATVIAVAYSRVYLEEHWPTDVIGAMMITGIILIGLSLAMKFREHRLRKPVHPLLPK